MAKDALQKIDLISPLLEKSIGLADLLQAAGEAKAEIMPATLAATANTLRDLLTQATHIVND